MSVIEKTWVLSYFELKLLIRNRVRLLAALILPIIGAIFFGMAGHVVHGLFLVLPISSLFILRPTLSVEYLLLPRPCLSKALAILPILATQAALYIWTAALI